MGNVFSKRNTLKDRLLSLENTINKNEYELSSLKLGGLLGSITKSFIISTTSILLLLYIFDLLRLLEFGISVFLICALICSLSILVYYYLNQSRAKLMLRKQKLIEEMKQERKNLIDLCKNDTSYSLTKSIIEKYDEDESRASYFNQVQRKQRSTLDSVSDFVFGTDPEFMNALICSKCGNHNGLIDPKNDNFKSFYCFHCKEKNIRKSNSILLDK